MVFSSPIFLFAFLPLTVIIYYILGKRHTLRNYWLLSVQLVVLCLGRAFVHLGDDRHDFLGLCRRIGL
jgi:D-alanyl-lipoteichoic acid acyltransferase DltB (MBOAT superfamily)